LSRNGYLQTILIALQTAAFTGEFSSHLSGVYLGELSVQLRAAKEGCTVEIWLWITWYLLTRHMYLVPLWLCCCTWNCFALQQNDQLSKSS